MVLKMKPSWASAFIVFTDLCDELATVHSLAAGIAPYRPQKDTGSSSEPRC